METLPRWPTNALHYLRKAKKAEKPPNVVLGFLFDMRYIGIDLAWGAKNTTAAVVLNGSDDVLHGATFFAYEEALTDDDSICDFVSTYDDGKGLLVTLDAPTLVPNASGRRPCEAILSSCLRRVEAGPHPANQTLLGGMDGMVRGERIVSRLAALNLSHTPYLNALPAPPRACFEVFPHPAHVALFGLEKTLKYKAKPRRSLEDRLVAYRRYVVLLESLETADPPLRFPIMGDPWWLRDTALMKPTALKRHEDALDALTCAYVALYRYRWGDARCPVVGDLQQGYIVTPATPTMQACFTEAAARLTA